MSLHHSGGFAKETPLSPYLFLICAEGFSVLLNKAEENGSLPWVKICHAATRINHLLFADDSLVLMKASRESASSLQNILNLYESCSGQIINYEKSSVMFSKNTKVWCKNSVLSELLPPFINISCFRFVKQMYLDKF
jgi:hypothetical protein